MMICYSQSIGLLILHTRSDLSRHTHTNPLTVSAQQHNYNEMNFDHMNIEQLEVCVVTNRCMNKFIYFFIYKIKIKSLTSGLQAQLSLVVSHTTEHKPTLSQFTFFPKYIHETKTRTKIYHRVLGTNNIIHNIKTLRFHYDPF